jgi:undecaprenyl-diphosphatase
LSRIEAVILGIVQGLTEFLPVSSSGHLVLLQHLFGIHEPELLFDICVHVGTLMAVLAVFRMEITALAGALIRLPVILRQAGGPVLLLTEDRESRMMAMIVAGSIPTALMGMLFARMTVELFGTIWLVGVALLITGTFLWFTRRMNVKGRSIDQMRLADALVIGVIQGLAIIPGISRSGATISAALFLGLDRQLAGRFSFLLAIPAILGALILGLDSDAFRTTLPLGTILLGSAAAGGVGYIALVILLKMVKKGQLYRFSPYCWIVGVGALVLSLMN